MDKNISVLELRITALVSWFPVEPSILISNLTPLQDANTPEVTLELNVTSIFGAQEGDVKVIKRDGINSPDVGKHERIRMVELLPEGQVINKVINGRYEVVYEVKAKDFE